MKVVKKIISLVTCVVLILSVCYCASAENIDISKLNHDELVALLKSVQLELFSDKLVDGMDIPFGTYVAGKDIPAGYYVISTSGSIDGYIQIQTYDVNGEEAESFVFWEGNENNQPCKIDISKDGMSVVFYGTLSGTTGIISIKAFSSLFAD